MLSTDLSWRVTNTINIQRLVQCSQSNISPTNQMLLASPAVALTSAMACRVHRYLVIESLDLGATGGKPLTAPKFADRQVVDETLLMGTIIRVSSESDDPHDSKGEVWWIFMDVTMRIRLHLPHYFMYSSSLLFQPSSYPYRSLPRGWSWPLVWVTSKAKQTVHGEQPGILTKRREIAGSLIEDFFQPQRPNFSM